MCHMLESIGTSSGTAHKLHYTDSYNSFRQNREVRCLIVKVSNIFCPVIRRTNDSSWKATPRLVSTASAHGLWTIVAEDRSRSGLWYMDQNVNLPWQCPIYLALNRKVIMFTIITVATNAITKMEHETHIQNTMTDFNLFPFQLSHFLWDRQLTGFHLMNYFTNLLNNRVEVSSKVSEGKR